MDGAGGDDQEKPALADHACTANGTDSQGSSHSVADTAVREIGHGGSHDSSFDVNKRLAQFWPQAKAEVEALDRAQMREASRHQELPLARIKKIMRLDEDVRQQMISSEAPLLLAKAAELFIKDLTLRAWQKTDKSKRKTLQKLDITYAISGDEMYDFLIDIVPREEQKRNVNQVAGTSEVSAATSEANSITMSGDSQQSFPIVFIAPQDDGQQAQTVTLVNPSDSDDIASGTVVQATPIGQPIQLPATSGGQPIQLIALNLPDGNIQQFQVQLPPTS